MDLIAGQRVVLMGDADSLIAVIHEVDGDRLDLELLESFNDGQTLEGTITVCVTQDGGLCHWDAAVAAVNDQRISLMIKGPPWTTQRRLHPRYVVDLPAKVRRIGHGTADRARSVQIVDLSHRGARVVGDMALETGSEIELDLDVGSGRLAARGTVALAYPDGHGQRVGHVAFADPDAEELRGIDRYLETLAS